MTTYAKAAFGTTLTIGGQAVAEITKVTVLAKKAATIDVTNHGSTSGYDEAVSGIKSGGELSVEGNFYPGNTNGQIAMSTALDNGTLSTFVITLPTAMATAVTLTGIVTAFSIEAPVEGKVPFSATIKVSGKPALAVTASADATTIAYEDSVGVKTSLPVFASSTYGPYSVTVATASTYIKVTVTDATAATITAQATIAGVAGPVYNLSTGVQSGQITIGAAVTTTLLTVIVTDTGKVPVTYVIYIVRP